MNTTNDPKVIPVEIIHYLRDNMVDLLEIKDDVLNYYGDDEDKQNERQEAISQLNNLVNNLVGMGLSNEKVHAVVNMLKEYNHANSKNHAATSKGCWIGGLVGSVAASIGLGWANYAIYDDGHIWFILIILNIFAVCGVFYFLYAFIMNIVENIQIKAGNFKSCDETLIKSVREYAQYLKDSHGYDNMDLEIALPQYDLDYRDVQIIIRSLK